MEVSDFASRQCSVSRVGSASSYSQCKMSFLPCLLTGGSFQAALCAEQLCTRSEFLGDEGLEGGQEDAGAQQLNSL